MNYGKKKSTAICLDVTTGCLDGPEMCELLGSYILSLLQKIVNKKDNEFVERILYPSSKH